MKKGFFILLFVVVLHSNSSWSQANLLNAKVPQEVGMKVVEDQSPIAYGYIDDRDVLWSKTIWEIIDLNERINFPLTTTLQSITVYCRTIESPCSEFYTTILLLVRLQKFILPLILLKAKNYPLKI